MDRVLDIDLDFFVYGTASWRNSTDPRLDAGEFGVWDQDKALSFLTSRCGLNGPLPGAAVEHHDEAFFRWRDAVDSGALRTPFEVVHVDAHADLGLGDNGYAYLLTDLLREPVEDRTHPRTGEHGLGAGNYLAFAIACRWVSSLVYVVGGHGEDYWWDEAETSGRPGDLFIYLHNNFDLDAGLALPRFELGDLQEHLVDIQRATVLAREPVVPFRWAYPKTFNDAKPYDFVTLARSPGFTPSTADPLYAEIAARFISSV